MRAEDARVGMRVERVERYEYQVVHNARGDWRCQCGAIIESGDLYAERIERYEYLSSITYWRCLACVSPVAPSGDHREARAVGGWQPGDELPEDAIRRGRDGDEA